MFEKKDKPSKRFVVENKEGALEGSKIIIDKKTGVNYLFSWDGYAGGLTPLLNSDGTVVVTPIENSEF